ncbi:MAG: ABC transporter substrate-binding protein [Deltaproteobacteria bacterium]|nr:MAG: ABC transporter substrate-binding protein [Deltaproteobacteria bacterium]
MARRAAILALFMHLIVATHSHCLAADHLTKVVLANGAISNNVTPLWIARDQGFFHKYGLEVDLVFIIAGRAVQAMLAGQVALGLVGATHVTNAVTGGGDLTMILGLQNKLDYLFIARPSIRSAEELKGKKVAIGTPAGSASLATYVALDYFGLMPRRDNIVLRSGTVEATSLSPEFGQTVQSEGYRVLLDTGKENIPFQSSGLVTSHKLMKSNPQLVENMSKAIIEAVAYIHNPANNKVVEQTLAKYLRLNKPDQIERAYLDLRKELPRKPCPTLEGIASVLRLMAQHGLNSKAVQLKPEDVADLSLCKKLDESGFMDRAYQGS